MTLLPIRLLLHDPGLRRTLQAGRATLAVAAAAATAVGLARARGEPAALAMLSVVVALQISVLPSARTIALLRTELLACLLSAAAVTIGALLGSSRPASAAGFVAVMAAATWASGFGPRGLSLGIVAFASYLFTQFTGASPGQLPRILVAVAVGAACALLFRHLILPDRPRPQLRWLLAPLRTRTAALALIAERAEPEGRAAAARSAAAAVDEIVLQLHDLLDNWPETVPDPRQFHRDLFAVVTLCHLLVLQAEGVTDAFQAALLSPPAPPRARLEVYLAALEAAATGASGGPDPEMGEASQGGPQREVALPGEQAVAGMERAEKGGAAVPAPAPRWWERGAHRRAVQVAVAGALAMAAGLALSPTRWYWAPMTTFFVFANAGTRGATLRKAVDRTLGTIGGVAAGLMLGSVLAGHTRLQLLAVFPLLFIGFWMLPVSYAVMTVAITMLLALVYAMMGMLTLDLLLLRLGETVVGGAIGVVVAYLLLPLRTRDAVDEGFRGYFGALRALLAALPSATYRVEGSEAGALEAARGLDRAVGTLQRTLTPVIAAVPGRRAAGLRQELMLALTARYWAHRVAARSIYHPGAIEAADLERISGTVHRRLERLESEERASEIPTDREAPSGPLAAALRRLDAVLVELARVREGEGETRRGEAK